MTPSELVQWAIETGNKAQVFVPKSNFEFTIHARSIPVPLNRKPADLVTWKEAKKYMPKKAWEDMRRMHDREELAYQKHRKQVIAEKQTVEKLQRIKRMLQAIE
jgi:hypothetical protein